MDGGSDVPDFNPYYSLFVCLFSQKKVLESDHTVADHEDFHDNCLNMEKWLKIMKQKLQSFQISPGKWSLEGRQQEVQV